MLISFAVFSVFGFKDARDVKRETSFPHSPSFSLLPQLSFRVAVSLSLRDSTKNKRQQQNQQKKKRKSCSLHD